MVVHEYMRNTLCAHCKGCTPLEMTTRPHAHGTAHMHGPVLTSARSFAEEGYL